MSYIPKPLSDQEMASLLQNTGELDPVWERHFYKPLRSVLAASGKKYHAESHPQYFGDARDFATKLWECHDESDMKSLVAAFSEGASQFAYVMLVTAYGMLPRHREIPLGVEPLEAKPYAALAFRGLEWLDDIEARSPGRTLPHP